MDMFKCIVRIYQILLAAPLLALVRPVGSVIFPHADLLVDSRRPSIELELCSYLS